MGDLILASFWLLPFWLPPVAWLAWRGAGHTPDTLQCAETVALWLLVSVVLAVMQPRRDMLPKGLAAAIAWTIPFLAFRAAFAIARTAGRSGEESAGIASVAGTLTLPVTLIAGLVLVCWFSGDCL